MDPEFIALVESELVEFENAANEVVKPVLYEGMRISDKFRALMNK